MLLGCNSTSFARWVASTIRCMCAICGCRIAGFVRRWLRLVALQRVRDRCVTSGSRGSVCRLHSSIGFADGDSVISSGCFFVRFNLPICTPVRSGILPLGWGCSWRVTYVPTFQCDELCIRNRLHRSFGRRARDALGGGSDEAFGWLLKRCCYVVIDLFTTCSDSALGWFS